IPPPESRRALKEYRVMPEMHAAYIDVDTLTVVSCQSRRELLTLLREPKELRRDEMAVDVGDHARGRDKLPSGARRSASPVRFLPWRCDRFQGHRRGPRSAERGGRSARRSGSCALAGANSG